MSFKTLNSRQLTFAILCLVPAIVAITCYPPNAGNEVYEPTSTTSPYQNLFLQFAGMMLLVCTLLAYKVSHGDLPTSTNLMMGLAVLLIGGFVLRMWCYSSLGTNFTFTLRTASDQQLVTSGPYTYLAHPSYLAQIVVIGSALALVGNAAIAAFFVAVGLYVSVNRIHDEEKIMTQRFGDEYQQYLSQRWKMIPFIY